MGAEGAEEEGEGIGNGGVAKVAITRYQLHTSPHLQPPMLQPTPLSTLPKHLMHPGTLIFLPCVSVSASASFRSARRSRDPYLGLNLLFRNFYGLEGALESY